MLMKRLVLSIVVLLVCGIVYAQKRTMLGEGKSWTYTYHHFEATETPEEMKYEETTYPVSFTLEGKATVKSKGSKKDREYFKIMRRIDGGEPSLFGYVREEGTATYMMRSNSDTEEKMTELNPRQFEIDYWRDNMTDFQDVIEVNGESFVRHTYKSDIPQITAVAVEGVGFKENGLLLGMHYEKPSCVCDYMVFEACYEGEKLLFSNTDFEASSSGTPTAISERPKTENKADKLYDLQGRKVGNSASTSAELPKGVYIKGGRKVIGGR